MVAQEVGPREGVEGREDPARDEGCHLEAGKAIAPVIWRLVEKLRNGQHLMQSGCLPASGQARDP